MLGAVERAVGRAALLHPAGHGALLPHRTLEMTDDFQVLVDGTLCDTLAGRQQVLQSYVPDSVCIQFDEIRA